MKGCGKIVSGVAVAVVFVLLYVHGQVMLLSLSYRFDRDHRTLVRKTEEYRQLKFQVDQLKAPRLLENKMKELAIDLTLPRKIKVVRVPAALGAFPEPAQDFSLPSLSQRVGDFLGRWIGVAQAKTEH
jgi:hypothetical protein